MVLKAKDRKDGGGVTASMNRYFFVLFSFFWAFSFSQAGRAKSLDLPPEILRDLHFSQTCSAYSKADCKIVPEFLKTQKHLCEINRATYNCKKFEKEKPLEAWKYSQCSYEKMCFDNNVDFLDSAAACVVGATAFAVDLAQLGKLYLSGVATRITQNNEWLKECDKSLECKKKLASSQPSTAYLLEPGKEQELKKVKVAYLMSRKMEYDSVRVQLMIRGSISKEQYYKEIGWQVPPESKLSQLPPTQVVSLNSIWETIKAKVDSEVSEVNCYVPFEKTRFKCQILSDVLSGMALEKSFVSRFAKVKSVSSAAVKESAEVIERRLSGQLKRIAGSSEPKKEFVAAFAQKNLTTKAENEAWLEAISNPSAGQRNFTIENSNLKNMNDKIFKDEEYVTALTNAYKEMQYSKLKILEKQLQQKNPYFKFQTFSDYKSVRMVYEDIPSVDITSLLRKVTEEANSEFANFTIKNKLVREADGPATWFKASVNTTDDLTNLTAKYARTSPSGSMFVDGVSDTGFKNWVQKEFTDGKQLRSDLVNSFKDTALVTSKNLGEANLSRDAFEILRKNRGSPDVGKALIEQKFGLTSIPDKTFAKLTEYFEKVDSFSPGLRNTERQFATLSEAPHGGVSIDMIGLGADHLQVTSAEAFAKSRSVDELLLNSRSSEIQLTEKIQQRKNEIESKFKSITGDPQAKVICSGDGCKAFLINREITEAEAKKFADVVTEGGEQGRLRFSEVKKLESREYQDLVAKQGEDLEKSLRSSLNGKVDPKRLDGINFSVLIKAVKPGEGTAKLHISEASGFKLSAQEKKIIEESYQNSLRNSNMGYK